ncbi:CaiB/BaiF CoA-transferase family protein [Bordetella sp. BOR01]|uniref:CaiB/BaiF CoA transferase family protein n=1 Tax=Bordetella sp. BOR01 TaxID=2854779 RepID=UPI001C467867|nr:CoA transferase [Bordetella sp. BOR01]MBV7484898.1 CoA transferase [Bordetella sp. BOR01]
MSDSAHHDTSAAGPLGGVRVIELTTMITGPLAGMMLGDWGADVVKVENPSGGDPFRSFRDGMYSPHFCAYNRNKRSVVLDLQSGEGHAALSELLRTADVLLDNYRPGVMQRLGLDDQTLATLNPRLVRCSITGFGPQGPYAERPAYDAITQAVSGMSSLFVQPDDPRLTGPTISDNVTGQYACQGILAALFEREKTGRGRRIDVNMLEATLAFMPDPFAYYTQMGLVSDPYLRVHTSQSFAFTCRDGKLLAVHLSSQAKFWEAFVQAIGCPELLGDERVATRAQRIANYEFLRGYAAKFIGMRPRQHWIDVFVNADVPCAPIYSATEVFTDPQVQHLDSFMTLNHPRMGDVVSIRRPVYLDGSRREQPQRPPPLLGEHTAEVLAEVGITFPENNKEQV